MPAARFWRIVGIKTYTGGDLELSELHLYGASGRLDATATLTSTIAPTAGTLAALQDDNLGTTCRFAAAAVRAGGFALVWDFGAGNTADNIGLRLGASADQSAFMAGGTLQYSTDGAQWQVRRAFGRFEWPGAGAYTLPPAAAGDPYYDNISILLHGDGADGSTTFVDSGPLALSGTMNAAQIKTDKAGSYGGAAIKIGDYGRVLVPHNEAFNFGSGDFTIEVRIWITGTGNDRVVLAKQTANSGYADFSVDVSNNRYATARVRTAASNHLVLSDPANEVISNEAWHTFAITRVGSAFRWFVDGVLRDTKTFAGALYSDPATPLSIGGKSNGVYACLNSYIEEVRITKGVGRYTTSYTPETGPFLSSASGAGGTVFVSPTLHTAASAAQIAASTPVPAFSTRRAAPLQLARDVEFGGLGTIYGATKTKGTPNAPTKARVVLLHQRSKLPVRETWSDPVTGYFEFKGIDTNQRFLALAEDAAGNFRPVAASRLVPGVAP